MDNRALANRCYDELMAVETTIHIATSLASDHFEDPLEDALQYDIDPERIGERWAWLADGWDEEVAWEAINAEGLHGWLLRVKTPVGATKGLFSWGHCYVRWVYGDTYEEALEAGFEWVRSVNPLPASA